ncbi:MAG: hypothetical protein HY589_01525 [Candidatus Omnitrophica bacterium]|nr:hypothetical protein [Candidatus Omnitrophota bacterium]
MYLSQSELKQLELLKKKKPVERFLLMVQLIDAQVEAMKAGIRYQNPEMSAKELEKCLRIKMMEMYFGKRWEEKFK